MMKHIYLGIQKRDTKEGGIEALQLLCPII